MPKKTPPQRTAPEICPVCGEYDIPPRAAACPECGADHRSGWRKDEGDDSGEDFNYSEFIENEFGATPKPPYIKFIWWLTALSLLLFAILEIYHSVVPR